jgi:hypothetical protein
VKSYTVSWDGPSAEEPGRGNEVTVSTVAGLDDVLDRVVSQAKVDNLPYAVQVHAPDTGGSVMIGVGHPHYSFVDWLMPKGHRRYAHQPYERISAHFEAFTRLACAIICYRRTIRTGVLLNTPTGRCRRGHP